MRITRELLHRIADDTVAERVKKDDSILAAYLHGTVLEGDDPVLGGAADIDLVFIHEHYDQDREIIRMTEDVHLDIEHHSKQSYQPAKELRTRPWLGNTMFACKPLYDPKHFLDFTQAGVRGLFFHYENVLARTEELMNRARATWLYFHNRETGFGPDQVMAYLQALEDAANAIASLAGPPLGGRRFLQSFQGVVAELGVPELYPELVGLLVGDVFQVGQPNVEVAKGWMLAWEEDLNRLNQGYTVPAALNIHRRGYYMRAYEAMLGSDQPETCLWPLLQTWTLMAQTMPSQASVWQATCETIGLVGEDFEKHLEGLDRFLDRVEVLVEDWDPSESY